MPILLQSNDSDQSWEYINRSHIQECRNWERGHGVSFIRMQKSDFRYSVGQKSPLYCGRFMGILLIPCVMANTLFERDESCCRRPTDGMPTVQTTAGQRGGVLQVQEEPHDPLPTLPQQIEPWESSRGTSLPTSYSSPTTRTQRIFKRNLTLHLLLFQTLGFFNSS